jgi:hypothetical protein
MARIAIGRRKLRFGVGVSGVGLAAGVAALFVFGGGGLVTGASTAPSTPTVDQASQQAESSLAASSPALSLPPSQAAAWIADWNASASCMVAHGISDYPNAPATFGDGKTPIPLVWGPTGSDLNPSSSAFQVAHAACPFDTSNLSASVFQEAWQQWDAAHPSTNSGPSPIPGQNPGTPNSPVG